MKPEIKIYTTTNCHYCLKAKQYFFERELKYTEIHVGDSEKIREELLQLTNGQMGVPVIVIDKKVLFGFNEQDLDELLNK